jgi:ribonuclease HII
MSKKGDFEQKLLQNGQLICGVDEVGRGCLAGPVCASAIVLNLNELFKLPASVLNLIRDSKKLSSSQRQRIIPILLEHTISHGIAFASAREVDRLNILNATFLAMTRAVGKLTVKPTLILVDGNKTIPGLSYLQEAIVGGDGITYSIAAASILAKEARDSYMSALESTFPQYGFASHVGYGTKMHLEAINKFGVLDEHRRTFRPVTEALESQNVNSELTI